MGIRQPQSIANRLALLFFAITFGAMAIVYVGVVPQLESSLTSERSALLAANASLYSGPINAKLTSSAPVDEIDMAIRAAADKANARVTLVGVGKSGGGAAPERLPLESWDVAIVFSEPLGRTTLVIDLDPAGGNLAAVGQPGRIGLGRIGPGLEKWVRSTVNADR